MPIYHVRLQLSFLNNISRSTQRLPIRIIRIIPNTMMAPEMIARVVRLLHSQQLLVRLLAPVPRRPVVHHIRALGEIAVRPKPIQCVV